MKTVKNRNSCISQQQHRFHHWQITMITEQQIGQHSGMLPGTGTPTWSTLTSVLGSIRPSFHHQLLHHFELPISVCFYLSFEVYHFSLEVAESDSFTQQCHTSVGTHHSGPDPRRWAHWLPVPLLSLPLSKSGCTSQSFSYLPRWHRPAWGCLNRKTRQGSCPKRMVGWQSTGQNVSERSRHFKLFASGSALYISYLWWKWYPAESFLLQKGS